MSNPRFFPVPGSRALWRAASLGCAALSFLPGAVCAQEVFVGAYMHDVNTPFSLPNGEGGADIAQGYRCEPLDQLAAIGRPAPYLLASINSRGDTSFVGGGFSWTIGKGRFYLRPAIGLIVHDGPDLRFDPVSGVRTDLGSRVLFEPELALGLRLDERLSVEASWMHVSHAQLFDSQQNPGIDMIGIRLAYQLR